MEPASPLSPRVLSALQLADQLHARQRRKIGGTPYIAHLLSVAALVIEDGGDEDEIIAALLHDAAEDQGGEQTLECIADQFGSRVACIVRQCSDSLQSPKPPWRQRKEGFLRTIPAVDHSALRIMMADKLHNLRAIKRDLMRGQADLWRGFRGGQEGTLWYYRAFIRACRARQDHWMLDEMESLLMWIARRSDPQDPASSG